jgi:hypothetical protein
MSRKQLFFTIIFFGCFTLQAQEYSVRTNILNLFAKGPSVAVGKQIFTNSETLLTFSTGKFSPFFYLDKYSFITAHLENRWEAGISHFYGETYVGPYVRFIHREIYFDQENPTWYNAKSRDFRGDGISLGVSTGTQWEIADTWFIDLNTMLGYGKYVKQVDYLNPEKSHGFLDLRLALQFGLRFK